MRRYSLIMALIFLWSGCTCGSKEVQSEGPAPTPEVSPSTEDAPLHELLDADGNLKASGDTYGALPLPVGLKLHREEKYLRVYRTHVPKSNLLRYFGPMLITGRVDEIKGGAVYRRASVRGAETAPFKLDVSIKEIRGGKTRVAITRFPPTPKRSSQTTDPPKETGDYWKKLD